MHKQTRKGVIRAPRPTRTPRTDEALAASHATLVEQVAALTVVVVQLWELHNALRETAGLARTPLPLAAARACAAGRQPPAFARFEKT